MMALSLNNPKVQVISETGSVLPMPRENNYRKSFQHLYNRTHRLVLDYKLWFNYAKHLSDVRPDIDIINEIVMNIENA